MTTSLTTMEPGSYMRLPLADIHDSPTNPRRIFDDAYIAELAADIKANDLQQPVKVRPRVPPMFADLGAEAQVGWELVFGHCRVRAARAAGLVDVPALVSSMTDEEVKRAQISENLSRRDVHPIEEAEGFKALIDDGSETADTLAERFGKSRSYVYGRLKLLQAIPRVRDACLRGDFGSEVLLLIARLRHEQLQERALKAIESKYYKLGDGGKKSFRDIRDLLAQLFTLKLKTAIFNPADKLLVPSAGACDVCPKLSGNAPEFEDLAQQREGYYPGHKLAGDRDLCTDPACWDSKHQRHLQVQAYKARQDGCEVIVGTAARNAIGADGRIKGAAYLSLEDARKALKAAGAKWDQMPTVHIQDQRTGKLVEAVAQKELKAKNITPPAPAKRPSYGWSQPSPEDVKRETEERAAKALRASRLAAAVVDAMRARERSREDLEDLAIAAIAGLEDWRTGSKALLSIWPHETMQSLQQAVRLWPVDEIAVLLMTTTLVTNSDLWLRGIRDGMPTEVERLVTRYGIDAEAAMSTPRPDEVVEASVPLPPAAQADKEGADASASAGQAQVAEAGSTPSPAARAGEEGGSPKGEEQRDEAGCAGQEAPAGADQVDEAAAGGQSQMDDAPGSAGRGCDDVEEAVHAD